MSPSGRLIDQEGHFPDSLTRLALRAHQASRRPASPPPSSMRRRARPVYRCTCRLRGNYLTWCGGHKTRRLSPREVQRKCAVSGPKAELPLLVLNHWVVDAKEHCCGGCSHK